MSTRDERTGFTLMEVTLTVGILAILLTTTFAISQKALSRSGLRTAENVIIQTLRRAQVLSQNNVINPNPAITTGSQWGVYIDVGSVILFARDGYNPPDTEYDHIFEINPRISFEGDLIVQMRVDEPPKGPGIVFTRFIGEPTIYGTITMELDGVTKQVTMNEKGVVERQ